MANHNNYDIISTHSPDVTIIISIIMFIITRLLFPHAHSVFAVSTMGRQARR